ncbi:hypothetical protein TWF481_003720 [Arthrobotrys musiformis]|uniref:C2H2-type domain-containing protein n=1 Tax=Arthrobotrys musiformis TaxID=47236 RepID=A0AAV9WJD8_9PEZI
MPLIGSLGDPSCVGLLATKSIEDDDLTSAREQSRLEPPGLSDEGTSLGAQNGIIANTTVPLAGLQAIQVPCPSTTTGNPVQETISSSTIAPQSPKPTGEPKTPVLNLSSSSLASHHRKPKVKKVYSCAIDNFRTTNSRLYGEHMFEDHGIKFFGCENCGFRTARDDNLKIHSRTCKGKSKKAADTTQIPRRKVKKRVSTKNMPNPKPRTGTSFVDETMEAPDLCHSDNCNSSDLTLATTSRTNDQVPASQPSEHQSVNPESAPRATPEDTTIPALPNSSRINELMFKIANFEQENASLKREIFTLKAENQARAEAARQSPEDMQEELERTKFECDVWQNKCRDMWKVGRKQLRENP